MKVILLVSLTQSDITKPSYKPGDEYLCHSSEEAERMVENRIAKYPEDDQLISDQKTTDTSDNPDDIVGDSNLIDSDPESTITNESGTSDDQKHDQSNSDDTETPDDQKNSDQSNSTPKKKTAKKKTTRKKTRTKKR